MGFIFEFLFELFGKRALGQLAGATLIGAAIPIIGLLRESETFRGSYWSWILGGGAMGFLAGLMLLNPKKFFGAIFSALGIGILVVPMNRTDGLPVGTTAYAIKYSIGFIMLCFGAFLLVRALKRMSVESNENQTSAGPPCGEKTLR